MKLKNYQKMHLKQTETTFNSILQKIIQLVDRLVLISLLQTEKIYVHII